MITATAGRPSTAVDGPNTAMGGPNIAMGGQGDGSAAHPPGLLGEPYLGESQCSFLPFLMLHKTPVR